MKYSDTNKPISCFLTQSDWYKRTVSVPVRGVLVHSTAANNPYISRYVQPSDDAKDREELLRRLGKNRYNNDWNHVSEGKGVHAFIGKLTDGTIASVQTGPWERKAWGCGSGTRGSCNNGWIQFEICEDDLNHEDYFLKVYQEAVELTAYLCSLYNLDPNGKVNYLGYEIPVILCHADSHKLQFGSNHADVLHWWPRFGKSMETFRKDVLACMSGGEQHVVPDEEPVISLPIKFQVKKAGLEIHSDPRAEDVILKPIEPGVFTITELRGSWGKLKSGAGWIWLDNPQLGNRL